MFNFLKNRHKLLFLFLPLLCFLVSSCSEDSVVEPPPPSASTMTVDTIKNLNGDTLSTGRFTYFSLSTKSEVTGADTVSNKWDIAFRGTTIWINGGSVRFGIGGAIAAGAPVYSGIYPLTNFDTISAAPVSGYGLDNSNTNLAIPTGSGNGWYTYDAAANYIQAIPGVVLLIKTGDGKYAKLEILSYYKNSTPDPMPFPTNFRFYTFRFTYQADGTTRLK
jgi:hypothetical protein